MKRILLLLFGFVTVFSQAQFLVEDFDITENSAEFGTVQIAVKMDNPVEYYRLKCESPQYAKFSEGDSVLTNQISTAISTGVNRGIYSVNGLFGLVLYIDAHGNVSDVKIQPEVKNSEVLRNDLKNIIQNLNLKWTPAECGNSTSESRIRLKVDFQTEYLDL